MRCGNELHRRINSAPTNSCRHGGRHSFEFATVVAIVGLLAIALLRALAASGEDVEEAAVANEAAAIRVELLDYLAHREAVGGALPASGNPLDWIGRRPVAYVGEVDRAPEQGGVWYYDRAHEELVYRFRSNREARFRLLRGGDAGAAAPGALAGVGLRRNDSSQAK